MSGIFRPGIVPATAMVEPRAAILAEDERCKGLSDLVWSGEWDELEVGYYLLHPCRGKRCCYDKPLTLNALRNLCHPQASVSGGCAEGDTLSLLFSAEASFFRCECGLHTLSIPMGPTVRLLTVSIRLYPYRYALSGCQSVQEEAAESLARVAGRVDEL